MIFSKGRRICSNSCGERGRRERKKIINGDGEKRMQRREKKF